MCVGAGALVAGRMAWRARRMPPVSGISTLVGRRAVVAQVTGEVATVRLAGAWWRARSGGPPRRHGQTVEVTGVDNLTLTVQPIDGPADKQGESDV